MRINRINVREILNRERGEGQGAEVGTETRPVRSGERVDFLGSEILFNIRESQDRRAR